MTIAIIVTGLPASGKTTIARRIARAMSFAFLDKDDFLETLYDKRGVTSWEDRKALSRQSDTLFQQEAEREDRVVLVSHWRPGNETGESGTPIEWVTEHFDHAVEVTCICDPRVSCCRFLERQRHPGHLDRQRNPQELARKMEYWAAGYPLNIGPVIEVDTQSPEGIADTVSEIDWHLRQLGVK